MSTCPSRMPANWAPPYPSWSGRFEDQATPMVFGYFGARAADLSAFAPFRAWALSAFEAPDGPLHVEWARCMEPDGKTNHVAIAYWRDAAAHDRWWADPAVSAWWSDTARETGPLGLWREINVAQPQKFETAFSSKCPSGMTAAADGFGTELMAHAYWGSMRDRFGASAHDPMHGALAALNVRPEAYASRVSVSVPDNLALIRSGQDWRGCDSIERAYYLENVRPTLILGMDYLRDHPVESGCLSCRLMDTDGGDDSVTFGLAHFRDLSDLEQWAEHHPTHLAIFGVFLKMVRALDRPLALRLWHEVIIIDGPASTYEYVNCDAPISAMRWLDRL